MNKAEARRPSRPKGIALLQKGGVACILVLAVVCGADGKTYDAACGTACVPVTIACQGECPCPGSGGDESAVDASPKGDANGPRGCQVNADCNTGQVCFV